LRSKHFAETPIQNVSKRFKFARVNQMSKSPVELLVADHPAFSFAFFSDTIVKHGDFQLSVTSLR